MSSKYPRVQLSPSEINVGGVVGLQRQIRSLAHNGIGNQTFDRYVGRYGDPGKAGLWGNAIEGALGELAVAKFLNMYHTGMSGFNATDVGKNFEVRTRRNPDHQLF